MAWYECIGGSGGSSSHTYSTTEKVVGKWTEGTTDVYEKVCTGTTVEGSFVLISGVDKIIGIEGHAGVYPLPAVQIDNNRKYMIIIVSNGDAKMYVNGSNYSGLSYEAVIRYIKS